MVIMTISCRCLDGMRAEDGKLHSHLEWPNAFLGVEIEQAQKNIIIATIYSRTSNTFVPLKSQKCSDK